MTDDEIQELSDYQHARLRTEMYLGSRALHNQLVVLYDDDGNPRLEEVKWVPARYTAFREIFDNSLDEVVGHGHGNRIDITYDEATGQMSVGDNGRGIPTDMHPTEGISAAELVYTKLHAGGKFNEEGGAYIPSLGINGIGNWDVAEGYQVKVNADVVLSITGTKVAVNTPIAIDSGWQFIPYYGDGPMNIETALPSISGVTLIVKDNEGNTYIPSLGINSIGNMEDCQGYQVKASSTGTLTYPE